MFYAFGAQGLFHRKREGVGGGGGWWGVGGVILKLAKTNNVSVCSRRFLWSVKCLTQASLVQKTLGRKWTSGREKKE